MAADPISILDRGDRQKRLHDHIQLVAGVDSKGQPQIAKYNSDGTPAAGGAKQLTGVPSSFAIQTADQTVFTLAAGEVGFIQVLSADAPLAVKLGSGASNASLNFILAAGTAANDGTGGAIRIDNWVGPVSVAKMAGTSSYLAWKQAP